MAKQIYVNLPVKDLDKTKEFFSKLGFTFNPKFSDDKAVCMIIGENIFAMLLKEEYFKTFIKKEVSDATKSTEVLIAIDVDSKEKVDEMVDKAVEAGAWNCNEPQDYGWMYYRSFADLDGHQWEIIFADESKMPQQP
jgi:uncharacterized protein